jgi:hypothetical protein
MVKVAPLLGACLLLGSGCSTAATDRAGAAQHGRGDAGVDGGVADASAPTNLEASTIDEHAVDAGCLPVALATCDAPSTPKAVPLAGWSWFGLQPTPFDQHAVWSVGPDAAWTAGAYGSLTYWDGTTPKVVDSGVYDTLTDLWGSSPTDVWAVGTGGAFLHYDGNGWLPVATPIRVDWHAVTGSGPNDVWAAGECGALIHYDGVAWSQVGTTGTAPLKAIWSAAPKDLWAMRSDAILRFDGTCWTKPAEQPVPPRLAPLGNMVTLDRLVGHGPKDVWVRLQGPGTLGVSLLWTHWTGWSWTDPARDGPADATPDTVAAATPPKAWSPSGRPTDISGTAGDIWAVGAAGSVWHSDGVTWSELSSGSRVDYGSVWGASPTSVFALSSDGSHLGRWDGATWKSGPTGLRTSPTSGWGSLSGTAEDDVWAAGGSSGVAHWDGAKWSDGTDPATPANTRYTGVWAASRTDVWALGLSESGGSGFATHWDGATWTKQTTWTGFGPRGIAGTSGTDVWVVGQSGVMGTQAFQYVGTILHFDGAAWSTAYGGVGIPDAGTTTGYFSSVVAVALGRAWAFGDSFATWNGAAWAPIPDGSVPYGTFTGWASAANDLWVIASSGGDLGHWDGKTWSTLPPPAGNELRAIWGTPSTGLWMVGVGGTVFRYLR